MLPARNWRPGLKFGRVTVKQNWRWYWTIQQRSIQCGSTRRSAMPIGSASAACPARTERLLLRRWMARAIFILEVYLPGSVIPMPLISPNGTGAHGPLWAEGWTMPLKRWPFHQMAPCMPPAHLSMRPTVMARQSQFTALPNGTGNSGLTWAAG